MQLHQLQVVVALWAICLLAPSKQMSVRRQLEPLDQTKDQSGDTSSNRSQTLSLPSSADTENTSTQQSFEHSAPIKRKDTLTFYQKLLDQLRGVNATNFNFQRDPTRSSDTDLRTLMAVLHSLMSDGTLSPLPATLTSGNPANKREGQSSGSVGHHVEDQLEERVDTLMEGEGEVMPQQMAEFTLEPHLGPAILPFQVPEGYFVPFLPRRAFGVVNGVVRPPHGHGTFYVHRPPGLVDVPNSPAFGFLFSGYRRFDPEAPRTPDDPSILYSTTDDVFSDTGVDSPTEHMSDSETLVS